MSVNVTVSIPLSSYLDLKAGRKPEEACGPDVLQALLRAIRTSPCEVIRKQPLAIEAPPVTKKVTYTKVTRFRKPDDCSPTTDSHHGGVLLGVEGSVDNKKYRVDRWTRMSSLKAALSKTNGIALSDFSLYYQGYRIKDGDTPQTLGMRNQDSVQMRKIVRPK